MSLLYHTAPAQHTTKSAKVTIVKPSIMLNVFLQGNLIMIKAFKLSRFNLYILIYAGCTENGGKMYRGRCYKFEDAQVNFDVAHQRCKALSINGYTKFELVSIKDDKESVFVKSLATPVRWEAWIGLKKDTSQQWNDFLGSGTWTDGGNILKQYWGNGPLPSDSDRVSIMI